MKSSSPILYIVKIGNIEECANVLIDNINFIYNRKVLKHTILLLSLSAIYIVKADCQNCVDSKQEFQFVC